MLLFIVFFLRTHYLVYVCLQHAELFFGPRRVVVDLNSCSGGECVRLNVGILGFVEREWILIYVEGMFMRGY